MCKVQSVCSAVWNKACLCRHFETFIRANTWQFSPLSRPGVSLVYSFLLSPNSHNLLHIRIRNCTTDAWTTVFSRDSVCDDKLSQDLHDALELRMSRTPVFMAVLGLAFLNRPTYWSKLADSLNEFLFKLLIPWRKFHMYEKHKSKNYWHRRLRLLKRIREIK